MDDCWSMSRPVQGCGECGDWSLIISVSGGGWTIRCWNGHTLVPIPGTVITMIGSPCNQTGRTSDT